MPGRFASIALAVMGCLVYAQVPQARAAAAPGAPPPDCVRASEHRAPPADDGEISRHLQAARNAANSREAVQAVEELRVAAAQLKMQADIAGESLHRCGEGQDRAIQDAARRLAVTARTIEPVIAALTAGKVQSAADIDKALNTVVRADLERRWPVSDTTLWYPVGGPQTHFRRALAAYRGNQPAAAAAHVRKAVLYLRLEAGRASVETKPELDRASADLGELAAGLDDGVPKLGRSMALAFAKADRALALQHRWQATAAWASGQYVTAGFELEAAATGLVGSAGWAGRKAAAKASATVAETRSIADKLVAGSAWTPEEVTGGFESMRLAIDRLGRNLAADRSTQSADAVTGG